MQKSKTVKKYDTYKDSGIKWIGEIPQEWKLQPLKMHTKIFGRIGFRGYTQDDLVAEGEGAITLSPTNIVDNTLTLEKCQYLSWNKYYESPEIMVDNGDILFVKTASVGKCAIYSSDELATINPQFVVFKNVTCNKKYLFYMLLSEVIQTPITLSNLGSVVGTIKQTELASYKIPIPNQNEQQQIAEYLDKKCGEIDKIVETEKSVIDKLKDYKQSIITEAVTKGLDKSVSLKDSGIEWIGKIPQHWDVIKLKKTVVTISDIDHYMPESVDNGYPYLMTGDLKDCTSNIDFETCKKISENDYNDLSSKIHPVLGDIIFARYATIGTLCYVDIAKDFLVSYSCLTIRPKQKEMFGKFLYYYLKSDTFKIDVTQYINSNTQSNIGLDSLQKVYIMLPNMEEQQQIAEYLDKKCSEIDKAIADKEQVIEKFTEYKKSLIYECVTGKRKVVG